MKHVSVNFIAPARPGASAGIDALRRATWLLENADHVARRSLADRERLTVVFVGDAAALPDDFLSALRRSFDVRVENEIYSELCQSYAEIVDGFGGPFQLFTFAFFRWPLIERLFCGEQVLCYDGDIVHNVPLQELSDAFDGLTRTATSTAFASISDNGWFDAWREGLRRLGRGVGSFIAAHERSLPGGRQQFLSSPEEHFAKCLIETGDLRQDSLPKNFPFWIVPQPHLMPRLYSFTKDGEQSVLSVPMRYERLADGTDEISGKPVAFWHMQKPFMSQLSALQYFERMNPETDPGTVYAYNFYGKLAAGPGVHDNDPYPNEQGHDAVPPNLWNLCWGLIKLQETREKENIPPTRNPFHPAFLYRLYFVEGDFSDLFSNKRWPKPDCWSR